MKAWRPMTFCLSWPDPEVEAMVEKEGHSLALKYDPFTVDAVIFPGGEDIAPFYYGQRMLSGTECNLTRDLKEVAFYYNLDVSVTPKIGICRGAQLLNVMAGGKLWQDVNNHERAHVAVVADSPSCGEHAGAPILVSSCHHQMMIPGSEAWVAAWSGVATHKLNDESMWTKPIGGPGFASKTDPEAIWYWNNNSMCYQPHPEWPGHSLCTDLFWTLCNIVLPKPKPAGDKKAA